MNIMGKFGKAEWALSDQFGDYSQEWRVKNKQIQIADKTSLTCNVDVQTVEHSLTYSYSLQYLFNDFGIAIRASWDWQPW